MARGFVYLAVVLDWFSRRALSWRVSITLEADFCVEALIIEEDRRLRAKAHSRSVRSLG
jgi:transposase InsO family protein